MLLAFINLACVTTTTNQRERRIEVLSEPSGASVFLEDRSGQRPVEGVTPTALVLPYEETTTEGVYWQSLVLLGAGAAMGGFGYPMLAAAGDNEGDSALLAFGVGGTVGSGLLLLAGTTLLVATAIVSGTTVEPPPPISVLVDKPGFTSVRRELPNPLEPPDQLNLRLVPDPNYVAPVVPIAPRAPRVVAVFPFQAGSTTGLEQGVVDQLTEYLSARLAASAQFRIIPREQLRAALEEKRTESYQACFDESCQIELGKSLAAEISLSTSLLRIGDTCALTATIYDLRTDTSERGAVVRTGCETNDLMGALDEVAARLTDRGS